MNPNHEPTAAPTEEQPLPEKDRGLFLTAINEVGRVALVRVMNLDHHSGVTGIDDRGGYRYSPDNQQYPDQGDFAFRDNALEVATVRGYPNNLHNIHILAAKEEDIIEPHPDDMPGVVYVKNGADVVAQRVPKELVEENIDRMNRGLSPLTTEEVIDRLSQP